MFEKMREQKRGRWVDIKFLRKMYMGCKIFWRRKISCKKRNTNKIRGVPKKEGVERARG